MAISSLKYEILLESFGLSLKGEFVNNSEVNLLKNAVEDYWNKQPCNIKHSIKEIGTKEYFDEVEIRKYFVEPHILKFADFKKYTRKKVLEIGCGIGTDAINFARDGAIYTGLELSSSSLDICKSRFEVFDLKAKLLLGDAENLPPEIKSDGDYDLIYSFGVLHHTPSIENAFQQISKICKSGTEFKFMVYAKNSYKNALISQGLEQPEAQYGCPIANTYTREEITNLLFSHGFEVKTISQDHIFPYSIPEYKKYEYKKLPWFEIMPTELFQALEMELGWHLLITASKI